MSSSIQQTGASDEELLRAMLEGEETAFLQLYRRNQGRVYRFALQMAGSAAVAEDVVQEVFLALMREGRKYDPRRGTLRAYLYGIARHKLARAMRRSREASEIPGEPASSADGPLEAAARKEEIRAVQRAVLALPAHYREAVVLCDLHEASYEEAAQALGCAVGTVRSRLHRGRELLAERLRARETGFARGRAGTARSWSL